MSGLTELYQEVILDHGKRPRNFGRIEPYTHDAVGHNPLCGDEVHVYVRLDGETIRDIGFEGCGCAISLASASMMTQAVKGQSRAHAEELFAAFRDVVTDGKEVEEEERLGQLNCLTGVKQFPGRVKCATLAWHALHAALRAESRVTTE